jgi:hypothetical protein
MIDTFIMMDHNTDQCTTFPDNKFIMSILLVPLLYNPFIYYLLNLFQNLIDGGFQY